MSKSDQDLLSLLGYKEKLDVVDSAILKNAEFLNQIVADPEIFGHDVDNDDDDGGEENEHREAEKYAQGGESTCQKL